VSHEVGMRAGLPGRSAELARVRAALSAAASGESATLLITGDAGVGKTALAQGAIASSGPEVVPIFCSCLPLQALSLPLHPLRLALRNSALPGAGELLAALEVPEQAPRVLDAWIDDLSVQSSVVLLVDDLQWADQSSLDVLVYLAAGPRARRFALLATIRRQSLPLDHPLHRWLADVLRLPGVSQLSLTGLDRAATETQLAGLLGAAPHQSLVDDVFGRTQGNPYWNRLLVEGLTPDIRRLRSGLPADLVAAVRRVWDTLTPSARDLSSLVAVGGRPIDAETVQAVAARLGWAEVLAPLRESVQARVLRVADGERYWFDHPLMAQVLEADLTAADRRRWHAAYATHIEAETPVHAMTLDRAIALADHHHAANHPAEAYSWALRSWELAGDARVSPELFRLLQRAVELRMRAVDGAASVRHLLLRLWRTAQAVGSDSQELAALDTLLGIVDPAEEPLLVSEMLVRRMLLRYTVGAAFAETGDVRRAAELASTDRTSWQYALALAEVAHTGFWAGDPDAPLYARQALEVARAAGHPRALCLALVANAMREVFAGHREAGLGYAREALDHGLAAEEWVGYITAVMWEQHVLSRSSPEQAAELLQRRRTTLAERGAPHTYVARISATEAEATLATGDWRLCQDRLRVTLGSDPGAFADVIARLTAARLAVWQGRIAEAAAHLERADELVSEPSRYLNFPYAAVRAEVLLATGRPAEAYRVALSGASGPPPLQDLSDWLIPLAARALADRVETARLRSEVDPRLAADIDLLTERALSVPTTWDPEPSIQWPALASWCRAELARARDEAAAELWRVTTRAAAEAGMRWLQAYAGWRAAEALLAAGTQHRADGRRYLLQTYLLADQLQAVPISRELTALSRTARVDLSGPAPPRVTAGIPGLTPREREILAYLVGGSTYAEIAEALVVSEKTVSSHVSNLLRKTGTTSRVELSRLAMRGEGAVVYRS
jgi:DNA-binding CsgD family transcriptional regulator